jgi:hypothetical protein
MVQFDWTIPLTNEIVRPLNKKLLETDLNWEGYFEIDNNKQDGQGESRDYRPVGCV